MPVYVPWKCQNPQNDKNHPHPPLKKKINKKEKSLI